MEKQITIDDRCLTFSGHDDPYISHIEGDPGLNLIKYCKTLLPTSPIILDVGANIGFTSAIFSVIDPNALIYSLEPGRKNYEFLTRNIAQNDLTNIKTFNVAAGNRDTTMSFKENSAWGYLDETVKPDNDQDSVRVVTLDTFALEQNLQKIDLIKIDVEGYEQYVFEGMETILNEFNPKIIFEFNSFCMLAYGNCNPMTFLKSIDERFKFKYVFNKTQDRTNEILKEANNPDFARYYLHQNIVSHGSVDDFLVYN